jgi:hypothetical protein
MDAQQKATKKWNKNNREHRNYLSKRSSARSFIRNHATMDDLSELEEIIKEKKEEIFKMITEKQLLKALEENFENFKEDMTFEEYADMLDFWVDKDGDILVEERGMEPVDGVRKVGYVDSGEVYVY